MASQNQNPHLLFLDQSPVHFHQIGVKVTDPDPKTRDPSGFMDHKSFNLDSRDDYFPSVGERGDPLEGRNWDRGGPGSSSSEEEEEEEDEGDVEGLVEIDDGGKNNGGGKIDVGNSENNALFGSSAREVVMKDGSVLQTGTDVNRVSSSDNGHQGRVWNFQKMVTVAENDGCIYYSQFQGNEGSGQSHKDIAGDNGCGFSGRKGSSFFSDHGESLRAIFSDPITGVLMDDAMILPCGHSFGHGGIEQVIKMKVCYTCSHPVSEDAVAPNLSLRVAVQAFLREEDVLMYRASKRRRERFEQDQGNFVDSSFSDTPRGRGVQFPFAVTDRVIIKGNKRTPQRFVGREAIVTTQCLNGWYVVKTVDNAESVKLQYRSLEKVADNSCSKRMSIPAKMTPNWL